MTIDEIDARLAPQLPNVVLSPATFQHDPALTELLQQYFSLTGGQVAVAGVDRAHYAVDRVAQKIEFSGVGAGGPFDGMPLVEVAISVVAGMPQLTIDGQPSGDWTLFHGFPEIASPIARDLPLQKVALSWGSVADKYHVKGFYLLGDVDFSRPPLSLLQFLFPDLDTLPIWGEIEMEGTTTAEIIQYVPDMLLVSDQTDASVTLGPFTLEKPHFKVLAYASFNTVDLNWQTHSEIEIRMYLRFQAEWFQVTVNFADIEDDVFFRAALDLPLAARLSEIVDFVGGAALEIPGFSVRLPDDLLLKDIRGIFDPAAASKPDGTKAFKLLAIDIAMAAGERWPLWGDVYLENIQVTFQLTPGTAGDVVDGLISGQIGDWLLMQAAFASDHHYSFSGQLLKPITIKEVYKFFTGTDLADLPDVMVATLDFTLDRPATGGASYGAEITIDTKWPILTEPLTIELDALRFTINHVAAENTTVTAGGVLGLLDYSVGLDATYDSTSGWMFDGTVAAGPDPATLADVVKKIDSELKLDTSKGPDIPPFLTDWFVESLGAQFATKAKDFDFTIAVENRAVPSLDLAFGVHLEHTPEAFTKTLDADARITTKAFAVEVAAAIVETSSAGPPPSKSFTLTGEYSAVKPPKLADLVAWVAATTNAAANLPAEIDLDAEANGFAVRIEQKDQDPHVIEVAGELALQAEGSDWTLYFVFTNLASFAPDGARALVNGEPVYVFGAALSALLDLSKLPLVGKIPGIDRLRIDKLGFFYTNAQFTAATPELHFDVPAIGSPDMLAPDATTAVLTQPGFTLMAVLGNETNTSGTGVDAAGTMPLPVATGQPMPGLPPGFAPRPAVPADPVSWLDLNKAIGPVTLQKIGLEYQKAARPEALGTIAFYLDGTFAIAGLALTLDRLGVSLDVPNPKAGLAFNPIATIGFHLGGLFVNYQASALQISGGFITLPGGGVDFVGEFTVIAGEFGLQAYGGFSNQEGQPSLFIFLHVEAPIGGPPFLFVNGLAGGFGVNRAFRLPTFGQLVAYPFLPASPVIPGPSQLTGGPPSQLATLTQALTTVAQYVPVRPGEYWLAAGLDVSSFHMIEVSAVLSAAFGVEFQIGVVGSASMTFPVGEPAPIAYVQVDFELAFSPSNGVLTAFGTITPASFLYSGLVHLSGGFAFDTWFSGPHAGNYVMTIGGYNLQYKKPPIYPDVPRLQMMFGIDSLNVTGQGYFALVPHALMAGLDVHATWSLGSLDAWFDADVNFLLDWKPFHYEAYGHVQIGVSLSITVLFVKVRITVHAGVALTIAGPPFGGRAVVDLDVVSFTIRFGDPATQAHVDWNGFRAFLPSVAGNTPAHIAGPAVAGADHGNKPLVNITAARGLLKTFKPGESPDRLDWLIDANGFTLVTQSAAPCTDATFNDVSHLAARTASQYLDPDDLRASVAAALADGQAPPLFAYKAPAGGPAWNSLSAGIPPLGFRDIQSTHSVTLRAIDHLGHAGADVADVIVLLQTGNYPRALWGNTKVSSTCLQDGQELLVGALAGFTILPMIWFPRRTTFISYYDLVFASNDLFLEQDALPAINATPFADPDAVYAAMESGALFAATTFARAGVVDLLQRSGFAWLALMDDESINTGQYTGNPLLTYLSSTSEDHLAA